MLGPSVGAPGVTNPLVASARAALAAALEVNDSISETVRRHRITEALELCKRPAAKCAMEDVLRLGYELRKQRGGSE
jgi:hypothetical protein